jgi:N-acetylglutamate synthase-like GNAT family acetyltransferase
MMYIRKATPEDVERIRFIVEECWTAVSGNRESQKEIYITVNNFYSTSKLINEINNQFTTYLLVIDEELAVAFASYKFTFKDMESSELKALYCLPLTQGKRYDELLLKEVMKNAINAGRHKIQIELSNYMGSAARFESFGFEIVDGDDGEKSRSGILVISRKPRMA